MSENETCVPSYTQGISANTAKGGIYLVRTGIITCSSVGFDVQMGRRKSPADFE